MWLLTVSNLTASCAGVKIHCTRHVVFATTSIVARVTALVVDAKLSIDGAWITAFCTFVYI